MDPLTAGMAISALVGLGTQLFGMSGQQDALQQQADISRQTAQVSAGVSADEGQINEQKRLQMNLESRRSSLENFRKSQQLQAQATAGAVAGNAQFGSGLQGGLAQISDTATEAARGINQGTEIGNNIFNLTGDISNKRQQIALLGGQMATAQGAGAEAAGVTSLGGSILSASGTVGKFTGNLFSTKQA